MRSTAALALVLAAACAGTGAEPTAAPATSTPTANGPVSTPADEPDGGGLAGGTATVILGDRQYEMSTDDLCQTVAGVQASMATADGQASVTVIASGSSPGMFALLDFDNNEEWAMVSGSGGWTVNGSQAMWTGMLEERTAGRTSPATVEVRCND
jgi:hypothetical protein